VIDIDADILEHQVERACERHGVTGLDAVAVRTLVAEAIRDSLPLHKPLGDGVPPDDDSSIYPVDKDSR
jgi:hypothetical protein